MPRGSRLDLTGQRFGQWIVLRKDEKPESRAVHWLCRCTCGNERPVSAHNLKSGRSTRCTLCRDKAASVAGSNRKRPSMAARYAEDLTGQKQGEWTALYRAQERDSSGRILWACCCSCGREKLMSVSTFRRATRCRDCRVEAGYNVGKVIDLAGKTFEDLTVLYRDPRPGDVRWMCRCVCGKTRAVTGQRLRSGTAKRCSSCGRRNRRRFNEEVLTALSLYRASALSVAGVAVEYGVDESVVHVAFGQLGVDLPKSESGRT